MKTNHYGITESVFGIIRELQSAAWDHRGDTFLLIGEIEKT